MLIMPVQWWIEDPPRGIVLSWAVVSSLGAVRNKKWWQDLVQRPSSVPWHMVYVKFYE